MLTFACCFGLSIAAPVRGGRPALRRRNVGLAVMACLFAALPIGAQVGRSLGSPGRESALVGPVPLRVLSPVRLLFFQLAPESASALGEGQWEFFAELSESNVLQVNSELRGDGTSPFEAELNLELSRLNLRASRGINERWDLGIEVPLYQYHNGFLDGAIVDIEQLVGDPKPQRLIEARVPGQNDFSFLLTRGGEPFLEVDENQSGLGDVAFTAKRTLTELPAHFPTIALRAALKVPTGELDSALGSDDFDLALGVAIEKRVGRFGWHGNLNATFPLSSPFEDQGLDSELILSGYAGAEYRSRGRWAAHLQLAGVGGPFNIRELPNPDLEHPPANDFTGAIFEVTPGISWDLGSGIRIYAGLVEDLFNTAGAASDVSLFVTLRLRPLRDA